MEPPKNATKVLTNVIEDCLDSTSKTDKCNRDRARRYAKKLVAAGEAILMKRHSISSHEELLSCDTIYSEYSSMFEHAAMAMYETDILRKLRKKEVDPSYVFGATMDTLSPEANKDIRAEIDERLNVKIVLKVLTLYKCPHCGKNEAIAITQQKHGADEPPVDRLECVHCNTKWFSKF